MRNRGRARRARPFSAHWGPGANEDLSADGRFKNGARVFRRDPAGAKAGAKVGTSGRA